MVTMLLGGFIPLGIIAALRPEVFSNVKRAHQLAGWLFLGTSGAASYSLIQMQKAHLAACSDKYFNMLTDTQVRGYRMLYETH